MLDLRPIGVPARSRSCRDPGQQPGPTAFLPRAPERGHDAAAAAAANSAGLSEGESEQREFEMLRQLEQRCLSEKEAVRWLFAEGMASAECKAAMLALIEIDVAFASALLNHAGQIWGVRGVDWQDGMAGSGHVSAVSAAFRRRLVKAGPAVASSRREARQRATLMLIAVIVEADWTAPSGWLPTDEVISLLPPRQVTVLTAPPNANAKGDLVTVCHRMGWSPPQFEVREEGSGRNLVFEASVVVDRGGARAEVGPVSGASRKAAERQAATAMLEVLGVTRSAPGEGAAVPEGRVQLEVAPERLAKGLLHEICQHRGWFPPFYEVTQAGTAYDPIFTATARVVTTVGDIVGLPARGKSKREAERNAAEHLLDVVTVPLKRSVV